MTLRNIHSAGRAYLTAITTLLQRIRKEDLHAGLYEAADLQWWWREDGAAEQRQKFWYDNAGPVATLLLDESNNEWDCNFFSLPSLKSQMGKQVLSEVVETLSKLSGPSKMTVREDDFIFTDLLSSHGWHPSGESVVQAHLAADPAAEYLLPPGFCFEVRAFSQGRPHPMTNKNRNPREVESRLAECSLYRADLDYAVIHSSEEVAAYALFWMDSLTMVGLIEPMRTENAFQRQGIGRALIGEGVRRLRSEGAKTIKVSYKEHNEAARRLYYQCGFRDLFRKVEYRKQSAN